MPRESISIVTSTSSPPSRHHLLPPRLRRSEADDPLLLSMSMWLLLLSLLSSMLSLLSSLLMMMTTDDRQPRRLPLSDRNHHRCYSHPFLLQQPTRRQLLLLLRRTTKTRAADPCLADPSSSVQRIQGKCPAKKKRRQAEQRGSQMKPLKHEAPSSDDDRAHSKLLVRAIEPMRSFRESSFFIIRRSNGASGDSERETGKKRGERVRARPK